MLRNVDVAGSEHFDLGPDGAVPDSGKTVVAIDNGPHGPTATILNTHSLLSAEFKRAGSVLILKGDDDKTATVYDYFAANKAPTLLSANDARLPLNMDAALAGPLAAGQYAQVTPAQLNAEALGRIATAIGNATMLRNGIA